MGLPPIKIFSVIVALKQKKYNFFDNEKREKRAHKREIKYCFFVNTTN